MFLVRVKSDNRWSNVTVGGRHFVQVAATQISEADMTEEIRNHPMLDVREVLDDTDVTDAAAAMMREHGLSPGEVVGTGKGGRVIVADVERTLADMETADDTDS